MPHTEFVHGGWPSTGRRKAFARDRHEARECDNADLSCDIGSVSRLGVRGNYPAVRVASTPAPVLSTSEMVPLPCLANGDDALDVNDIRSMGAQRRG